MNGIAPPPPLVIRPISHLSLPPMTMANPCPPSGAPIPRARPGLTVSGSSASSSLYGISNTGSPPALPQTISTPNTPARITGRASACQSHLSAKNHG
jgi:hypothetical protein